jgi:hypothetical protein
MVRYYAKGEYPVSQMLALLLRVMARKKISPDVVAALLPLK